MGEPQTLRISFGEGLDRHSGVSLADPQSFADLRNIDLRRGAADVRKGLGLTRTITLDAGGTPMSTIVAVGIQSDDVDIDVAYYTPTRKLQHWIGGGFSGTTYTFPGVPDNLQFHLAEAYDQSFLAHAGVSNQMPTMALPAGAGVPLSANLDGFGAASVFFKGICSYLDYLVGWGFGSNSDANHPEIIRISLPGQPTVFNAEHYFKVGARFDPVMNCIPVGGRLLVFKTRSIHPIVGSNRANFGVLPAVDRHYGLAGRRLAVLSPWGTCYFWSNYGPRMTDGGPSQDLALPLALGAPEPADLVATGAAEDGFAIYIPGKEQVQFVFGRRAYVLHLRDPSRPRWSYHPYGVALSCAGLHTNFNAGPGPNESPVRMVFGRENNHHVLTDTFGIGGTVATDDGTAFQASAKSDPVAPASSEGECVFRKVTLSIVHTMPVTLLVTPVVDGVELPFGARVTAFTAKGSATLEARELDFSVPYPPPPATELGRSYPRGTWFSLKVETTDRELGGAGDLSFEQSVLEYEVTRERRPSQ